MKKITLLTAALLSVATLGGQTLTTQAAGKNWQTATTTVNGNRVVVSYNGNCDVSSLLDKLKDCFPSLNPSLPDTETPDNNTPDTETPDNNTPDTETPDNNTPDTETPDNNTPDTETPDNNKPDNNKPDNNQPGTDTDSPEDNTALSYAEQVVNLVNAERAKEGLSPLKTAKDVQAAAQVRAKEIETSFSHTRPNGSNFATALKEQNVSYRGAGENIAWGQRSPEEVVNAWMNSSGHRANIMNAKFTTIGVGYHQNANGVKYWSQLFTY